MVKGTPKWLKNNIEFPNTFFLIMARKAASFVELKAMPRGVSHQLMDLHYTSTTINERYQA